MSKRMTDIANTPDRSAGARRFGAGAVGALATLLLLAGAVHARTAAKVEWGANGEAARRALAEHELRLLDGKTTTLSAMRGEVVVVNFWASWCKPCRRELPALNALNAELAKQGGNVVAISIDEERDNVKRFARANGLSLPIAHDGPDGLARQLDLKHVPFTIILDRSGQVAFSTSGADGNALESITAAARQLVARAPVASDGPAGGTP
jgi:thiol-disulfide isomerase/thioredoxin